MSKPHKNSKRKGNNNSEPSFYWQHYRLNRDPFSAIQDDTMYVSFSQWEHHLDLLRHLIKSENVLLAVVGSEGSGKTTFAHQFIKQSSEAMRIHHFKADSLFSTRKLVHELEQGFNLKAPANTSPEEQLESQIEEVQYTNQTTLLLIDNAHFLPLETLTSLLFLLKQQSKDQMRLHILLFGDKHLQAKLSSLARHELRGEMIHSIELEPLTTEETEQYIQQRLHKSGLNGVIPLSQMSIEHIHSVSRGIPERINHLTQQALLDDITKQQAVLKPTPFKRHKTKIVGGALLLIALAAASYLLNHEGRPKAQLIPSLTFVDRPESLQVPTQQTSIENTQQVVVKKGTLSHQISKKDSLKPALHKRAHITKKPIASHSKKPEKQEKPAISLLPAAAPVATELAKKEVHNKLIHLSKLERVSALPITKSDHIDIIAHPKLATTFRKTQLGEKNTLSKHEIHKVHQTTKPKQAQTTHELKSKSNLHKPHKPHQATKLHQAQTAHELKSKPNLHKPHLSLTERRLMKMDPGSYTLQVLGVSHKTAMTTFIATHHLAKNSTCLHTTLNGKPWYILLYGSYPTHQAATKAIDNLPAVLKQFKPWARSYTSLRKTVEQKG